MSKVKEANHICIHGWMVTLLNLSGNDLMVYAIIYGYSQGGNGWFEGSRQYLADWCNSTVRGIQKNLDKLVSADLLEKRIVEVQGVKFCNYRCVESSIPVNIVPTPSEQSSHHNIEHNIDKRENVLSNDNTLERKKFVPPSIDEIKAYIKDKGYHFDAEAFWAFYDSNGWMVGKNKMKNWKSACVTWEKKYKGSGDRNSGSMDWLDNWTPDPELTKMFNETRKR